MENKNLVRVKLWSDRKHYTIVEVREDEVEKVKTVSRMNWQEDKAEERKRIKLEEENITICSFESLDEDGSWIPDESNSNPLENLIENEEQDGVRCLVASAIHSLSARQQLIVNMYFFEEKSLRQIAKELGVHFTSVQECLDVSLQKIKIYLEK